MRTNDRKYCYRGLSMSDSPYGWCIEGNDIPDNASGILEWCYDRNDARDRLNRMRQTGEFTDLQIAQDSRP